MIGLLLLIYLFSRRDIKDKTWEHLSDFGKNGLRTLVLAKRKIEESVFNEWHKKYQVILLIIKLKFKHF